LTSLDNAHITKQKGNLLSSNSAIPQDLIQEYITTDFCVDTETPFVLKIGKRNENLLPLYQYNNCECAAFLTAFNPYSQAANPVDNEAQQMALHKQLIDLDLKTINGAGKDPKGVHPAELSFLVLGAALSLEMAKQLAETYKQNAFVWCGSDAVPELVLMR
jgi:hypothetical protein